jgi:hypothetical protein
MHRPINIIINPRYGRTRPPRCKDSIALAPAMKIKARNTLKKNRDKP